MKTARDIINDCFFKGRKLDYKQHKAIVEELNARDEQFKELLDTLKHINEYWNEDRNDGAMFDALWHIMDTAEEIIDKAEANHA